MATPSRSACALGLSCIIGCGPVATETVVIGGQQALVSLGRLHEIALAGDFVGVANYYNNRKLPYSEILKLAGGNGAGTKHRVW